MTRKLLLSEFYQFNDYYTMCIKINISTEVECAGCIDGKFGRDCTLDCNCADGSDCGVDGSCASCGRGWTGPTCQLIIGNVVDFVVLCISRSLFENSLIAHAEIGLFCAFIAKIFLIVYFQDFDNVFIYHLGQ